MSDIRAYTKKKENTQNNDFKNLICKHRLGVFYRVLLVLLLIVSVAAVTYIYFRNKIYTQYQVVSTADRNYVEGTTSINFNGNILTYSNDGANCTNTKGTVLWNQTYEMQNPIVVVNENIVAIGDYNGRTIYVMNTEKMLGQIETGIPVRDFCVSGEGIVAAVLDDSNTTLIDIFGTSGNRIATFKTTMKKSGYPIAVSLSPNSELVGISYLYADSGYITSNIAFYNIGEVGQNVIDKFVSGYPYNDVVVPELHFMNEATAFAVADNRLMIYKGKQIPTNDADKDIVLEEEVQSVYYDDSRIALVYINSTGKSKYLMDIFNDAGKKINTVEFNLEYMDICFNKENIIIYNDSECVIYNMSGVQKYAGAFTDKINTLIPTTIENKYIFVTGDKIETIELK